MTLATNDRFRSPRRLTTAVLTLTAAAVLWVTPPKPAEAGLPVLDISNLVQNIVAAIQNIVEVSQQVSQLTNEASQIANQVSMLQDMANQASTIGSPSWGQVQSWINNLAAAAQVGNAMIYNMPGIAGQIQNQFPGYQPPVNWNTEYQQYSAATIDTMRGTLASAGMNISDVNSVESALNALKGANNGATGRNELAQIANSLASLQIEEMTKMRQLLALEINAKTVAETAKQNEKAAGEASLGQFINSPPTVQDPRAQPGFSNF